MIEQIRKRIEYEEFDYQTLMNCLEGYSRPRDKLSDLLRKKDIVRIKKGLYIFGDNYRRRPYSREILANLIYGPSYISLEYALHYYGLIPERVEAVTSVTSGRSRKFFTPGGLFVYRNVPLKAFQSGMDMIEIEGGRSFLIATPEKALADKIRDDRGTGVRAQRELQAYLVENLRVDQEALLTLNTGRLDKYAEHYHSRKVKLLADLIRRLRNREEGIAHV